MNELPRIIKSSQTVNFEFLGWELLTGFEQALLSSAINARERAVAEYSHYLVGAAVQWVNGEITVGCNVENCTYNVLHAEKAAIVQGVYLYGPSQIERIAVVGGSEDQQIQPPQNLAYKEWSSQAHRIRIKDCCVSCGQCLQDILEFSFGENISMYMLLNGVVVRTTLYDMLPARFGPHDLGIDYGKRRHG